MPSLSPGRGLGGSIILQVWAEASLGTDMGWWGGASKRGRGAGDLPAKQPHGGRCGSIIYISYYVLSQLGSIQPHLDVQLLELSATLLID